MEEFIGVFIFSLIGCLAIFLLYFLSGAFYIIKKPQIIINKKLYKIQKKYKIIDIDGYLTNLGKLNIYSSIIFLFGYINAIYMDLNKYHSSVIIYFFYFALIAVVNNVCQRKMKKYLVLQNNETIDK